MRLQIPLAGALMTILSACGPEVTLQVEVLHGEHAGPVQAREHNARVVCGRRSLEGRGQIPVRGLCPAASPSLDRVEDNLELHINLQAGRAACPDQNTDAGIAYVATISPLRPGSYTVHIDHALLAPVTDSTARIRLDHYSLPPVRVVVH